MSEFNEHNWKEALVSVYERSIRDLEYRSLCLNDPVAAIKAVSDIEVPDDLKVQFFDTRTEYLYTYLLPPAGETSVATDEQVDGLVRWNVLCTVVPTGK